MFKRFTYPALMAMLILAGYLNFSLPANAAPVTVVDDAYVAYQGVDVSFSPHPFDNDTDPLGNIYATDIDLDPATPGIQSNKVYPGFGTAFSTYNYDIQFTPEPGFLGTSTIQYTTHNADGESNIGTITIEYYPNLPPSAVNDSYTIAEGGSLAFYPTSNDDALGGSLDNDTIDLDVFLPGIQTSTTTSAGYFEIVPSSGGELRVTATSTAGTYILQYTVNDESLTSNVADIEFNVIVDAPPVAVGDTATNIVQGDNINFNVLANDSDPEGYTFSYTDILLDPTSNFYVSPYTNTEGDWVASSFPAERVFYYNNPLFVGTTTFQYRIKDQYGNISNFAPLEVFVESNPPTAGDDSVTGVDGEIINIPYYVNDTWPAGLSYDNLDFDSLTPGFQNSATTSIGTFVHDFGSSGARFETIPGLTGVATTTYQIFDSYGFASNIAMMTVTVNTNTPPVANDYTYPSIYPEDIAQIDTFNLVTDPDMILKPAANFDLDFTLPGRQQTLSVPEGTWTPGSLILNFNPIDTFLGTLLFPFTFTDSGGLLSNVATVTLNVINDDPVASDDNAVTAIELPVNINVLNNDSPFGGTLTDVDLYPATSGTNETSTTTIEGLWVLQPDKTVLFSPASGFSGTAATPYVAIDSFGARSVPANIYVDVQSRPFLRIHHGAVAKSTSTMTFDPSNVPPVSDIGSSCPRIPSVNSNALTTASFKSDLRNVGFDAEYTGMAIIENVGDQPAYDVIAQLQQDSYLLAPAGGRNVCVMKGDGTVLTSGLDYFGEFVFQDTPDPILAAYHPTNGTNIIVITYDVRWPFVKNQTHEAYITNYAALDSGPSLLSSYEQDNFTAFAKRATLTLNNSAPNPVLSISGLTIGQRIEYQVEIEVPETASSSFSSSATIIRTTLPEGMAFYDNNTGILEDYVTYSIDSAINNISPNLQFVSERILEFSFSDYFNTDTDPLTVESINLNIPAVVLDTATNTASTGVTFVNTVELIDRFDNETTNQVVIAIATSSAKLLQEPALILRNLSATSTNTSGTIQYLFELFQADGVSSRADAYEVEFYFQTNGPGLTPLTITNPITGGLPAATTTIGSLYLAWPIIAGTYTSSSPITISFTGTITPTTSTTILSYPVGLSFSTLPGSVPGPLSSLDLLSRERLYVGTSTYSTTYVLSGPVPSSTPTTTTGCIGSCGGPFVIVGCIDPNALNYNKWATVSDGSCIYPIVTPTSTPPATTTPPVVVPPTVIPPSSTTSPITYIPKAKRQVMLQLTGPLESLQTKLRKDAIKVAVSEGNAISIPYIGEKKPVLMLPNLDPLLNEFWLLPWGSTPDKGNNTILVAHSYNQQKGKQWPNILFNLDKVKVGEKITFDWKGKKYTYQVIDNNKFDAKDVYIEDDTKESVLTIYGCGKYTTKYRQVVRALLVGVE